MRRLLASVERANAEKTARVEMTMTLTGQETLSVTGIGVVDLAGGQMSMSLKGTANGRPVSIDARLVGNTIYSRTDRDWLSEPVDDQDEFTPNPASYLAYLQGASDDVHEIGPAVLRGVDTTEYGANIDLTRARARARTSEQRLVFSHALELFGAVKMPAKVWIDTDGRLRKMQVELDLAPALRRAGEQRHGKSEDRRDDRVLRLRRAGARRGAARCDRSGRGHADRAWRRASCATRSLRRKCSTPTDRCIRPIRRC